MNIPDFMPILKSGSHIVPQEGACFMEMIAFLNGEQHSDKPSCVHPRLVPVGIIANDFLSDKNRQKMLDLMGAFMGTDKIDIYAVRARVQQEVLPEFYNWFNDKATFQNMATCKADLFSLTAVERAIFRSFDSIVNPTEEQADMHDEAVIEYVTAVADILKDMKGESEVKPEAIAEHPAVKANV